MLLPSTWKQCAKSVWTHLVRLDYNTVLTLGFSHRYLSSASPLKRRKQLNAAVSFSDIAYWWIEPVYISFKFRKFCYHLYIRTGGSRKEITEHWEWLEQNLLQTLSIFENENDITTFVRGKIQVVGCLFCLVLTFNWKEFQTYGKVVKIRIV